MKRAAKRTRLGVIGGRIAVERTRDVRRGLGHRGGLMGATHLDHDVGESVDYVNGVFGDYLTYGRLQAADIGRMRVLEVGPGDSLGVALLFVANGSPRVVATDRFIPYRDPVHERAVYAALIEGLPAEQRERVESVLGGDGVSLDGVPLEVLEETPIEEAPGILGEHEFDLVVSRAVLEHVYDLDTAFDSMDRLLAPGGLMIHKVDLRDHNLFTAGGHQPLTFLTVRDRVWSWMGEESAGLPNRVRIGWYRRKMEALGYESTFLITHLAGVEEELEPHLPLEQGPPDGSPLPAVSEIRPKLLPRFRSLGDRELAIAGFMLVARKPAA